MKSLGFLLLPAGWALVLLSLILLSKETPRATFVLAGLGVEIIGIVLVIRAHTAAATAGERDI